MSDIRPLRIVSIAHPAVSSEAGRLRYPFLAAKRDVELHLVLPAIWKEFGRTIVAAPPDETEFSVHVLPILLPQAGPMNWYLHFYPALRRLLRRIDPDVIHLWEEPWSIVALQAELFRGRAGLVLEVDQNILKRLPPPFEAIRKYVLGRTDHVLSRSPDATMVVRARGYAGPVTPIGYGVDIETFTSGSSPAAFCSNALRIGYVGRLIEEKGLDEALDAMALSGAPVSLAIMGEGPYEAKLRERAAALGLGERVTFRGWGQPADVADFIRRCDALVLLTRTTNAVREQFGRVIIEAQACGVPVIGSSCGAIPDVVGDGGWIVPERDAKALRELLDKIAGNAALIRAKGLAARENVRARFTYEAVATALLTACKAAADAKLSLSA
ncbi:glycosyltransferase [Bradyrhizobium sp. Tv2a-2]|uniref:glycosyltransferase n=1 Tax=Bradyrhizobium sp. Tv2a-2 TaxID=113395 RepID=UPI0003F72CB9|nr:glycosyltransferase [Bradyrhizobium sp. Tv2a-2]